MGSGRGGHEVLLGPSQGSAPGLTPEPRAQSLCPPAGLGSPVDWGQPALSVCRHRVLDPSRPCMRGFGFCFLSSQTRGVHLGSSRESLGPARAPSSLSMVARPRDLRSTRVTRLAVPGPHSWPGAPWTSQGQLDGSA